MLETRVTRLTHSDRIHVEAAQGWLGLGDWREANEELDRITPTMRVHPDVLKVRWAVCAKSENWELGLAIATTLAREAPQDYFGFIKRAYARYKLGRTEEAYGSLAPLPVLSKFPKNPFIRYDLARYACLLGKLKEAMEYLGCAIDLARKHLPGKVDLRQWALDDPVLEPLWVNISEI